MVMREDTVFGLGVAAEVRLAALPEPEVNLIMVAAVVAAAALPLEGLAEQVLLVALEVLVLRAALLLLALSLEVAAAEHTVELPLLAQPGNV